MQSVTDQAKAQIWIDADHRCQDCGAKHNSFGYHDPQGRFYEVDYYAQSGTADLAGGFVVLRVVDLDSDVDKTRSPNYRLLCSWCEWRRRDYDRRADLNRPRPAPSGWLRVTHSYSRECGV